MSEITQFEKEQIEKANDTDLIPAVFVHGLWLLPSSWDRWRALFEEKGFATLAPGWPDDPNTVEEADRNPDVMAHKSIGQIWFADYPNRRIEELSPNGTYLDQFGGTYSTGPDQFTDPGRCGQPARHRERLGQRAARAVRRAAAGADLPRPVRLAGTATASSTRTRTWPSDRTGTSTSSTGRTTGSSCSTRPVPIRASSPPARRATRSASPLRPQGSRGRPRRAATASSSTTRRPAP